MDETAAKLAIELDALRAKGRGNLTGTSSTHVGNVSIGGTNVDVSVNRGMAIIIVSPPAWDTGATCDGCGNSLKDRGSPEDKVYTAKLRQLDARAAKFADGCMSKIAGDLAWLPRVPSNGEPGDPFAPQ